jgi:hypothetical protein
MVMRKLQRSIAVVALAGVAVLVPAPAHASGTNDRIVNGWYRDFLQRGSVNAEGDYGREYWVNQLNGATDQESVENVRSAVLGEIVRSPEYVRRQVDDSYRAFLGRKPDPGASFWVDGVSHRGMALEWVDQNLLASQELHSRWAARPNGDDLYVQQLYVHVLGRYAWETTPGERAYWVGRIRAVGRLAAVRELWYADEAVRHRLAGHYLSLLCLDEVDRYGLHYWYPREVASDLGTAVAIASTDKYAQRLLTYKDPQVSVLTVTYVGPSDKQPGVAIFTLAHGDEKSEIAVRPGETLGAGAPWSLVGFVNQAADRKSATVRFDGRDVTVPIDKAVPLNDRRPCQ